MLEKILSFIETKLGFYKIYPNKINHLNSTLRSVTQLSNAHFNFEQTQANLFNVSLHLGIPGPVHKNLIEYEYMGKMLHGLYKLIYYQLGDSHHTTMETLAYPNEENRYYIQINSIPEIYAGSIMTVNSIYHCLLAYKKFKSSNDLRYLTNDIEISPNAQPYVEDLTNTRILSSLTKWKAKKLGANPGIIIQGNDNSQTYLKVLSRQTSLDVTAMKIARRCGVSAPKVEMLISENHYYQISPDLNNPRNDKHYQYRDFSDYLYVDKDYYFNFQSLTLFCKRQTDGTFAEYHRLEKTSIARLIIIAAIFAWGDLRDCNFGIIINQKGQVKKAKLAIIDFTIDLVPFIANSKYRFKSPLDRKQDLLTLLTKNLSKSNPDYETLNKLAQSLSLEDYMIAFEKINARFELAYQEVKPQVDRLFEWIAFDYSQTDIDNLKQIVHEIWHKNFNVIKDKVEQAKLTVESQQLLKLN